LPKVGKVIAHLIIHPSYLNDTNLNGYSVSSYPWEIGPELPMDNNSRVKNHLRATMSQDRLDDLAVMSI